MKRAGTASVALAVAVLAVAVAGCGGGGDGRLSKSEDEQKLKAEGKELKTAFNSTDLRSIGDVDTLARRITKLQNELDASATDIEELQPPKDAEADNAKVADALHKAADKFGELKGALKAKDEQRLERLSSDIDSILEQGRAATEDLKAKGYDIGALGQD